MKMNRWPLLMALAVLCFLYGTVDLAAQRGRADRGQHLLEKHKTALQLSSEQETQLTALQQATKEKMKTLRQQEDLSPEGKRAQVQNIKEEHKAQMEQILSAEQLAQWKAIQQEEAAARKEERAAMQERRKAMYQEMVAYKAENVLPVLRTQRNKLENQISAADKAAIAELRTAMQEAKAARKAAHAAKSRDDGERQSKHRGHRRHTGKKEHDSDTHQAMREQKERVKALVEKYEKQIDQLFAEIEPQTEQWRKDQKEIAEKYRSQAPDKAPAGAHFKHRGPRGPKPGGKHAGIPRKAHFLLMDPDASAADLQDDMMEAPLRVAQMSVYPNPARTSGTFAFEVMEAGEFSVELRDESGQVIRPLAKERFRVGEQELNIDLSNLRDGVYIISVTDAKGQVATTRFVKGG